MIHKPSLLREFKRDKRPVYTCNTWLEHMGGIVNDKLYKLMLNLERNNYHDIWDHVQTEAIKTMKVIKLTRLPLPNDKVSNNDPQT